MKFGVGHLSMAHCLLREMSFIKITFFVFVTHCLSESLSSNSLPFLWFPEYKYPVSLLLIFFNLFILLLSLSSVDCFVCIVNLINNHIFGLFQRWKIDVKQEGHNTNNTAVDYSPPSRLLALMKLFGRLVQICKLLQCPAKSLYTELLICSFWMVSSVSRLASCLNQDM